MRKGIAVHKCLRFKKKDKNTLKDSLVLVFSDGEFFILVGWGFFNRWYLCF